jgi:hypothetical protein
MRPDWAQTYRRSPVPRRHPENTHTQQAVILAFPGQAARAARLVENLHGDCREERPVERNRSLQRFPLGGIPDHLQPR